MQLSFFNTISGKKEIFKPYQKDHIKMYVCGPTVYSRPHVGNLRSVVCYDLLYRLLRYCYPKATYVRNITDVDDKIINASLESDLSIGEITKLYADYFTADCEFLNCLEPDIQPKATEEIESMIALIRQLIDREFAYLSGGNVLFSVKKFKDYGALSGKKLDELITGIRVATAHYKHDECDFVLWKPADKNNGELGWESPFGYGRPGWHIECSAMSTKYLGENFDIHGGGIDLQFPHHENEIAQSVCASDSCSFAKYWIHNGFLTIDGVKMSKSLGNITTVGDLQQIYCGATIRMALLSADYGKPLDLTDEILHNCAESLAKFAHILLENFSSLNLSDAYKLDDLLLSFLCDDLNFTKYQAMMFSLWKDARDTNNDPEGKKKTLQKFFDAGRFIGFWSDRQSLEILFSGGLRIALNMPIALGSEGIITKAIQARAERKKNKDFKQADAIRLTLQEKGIMLLDQANITTAEIETGGNTSALQLAVCSPKNLAFALKDVKISFSESFIDISAENLIIYLKIINKFGNLWDIFEYLVDDIASCNYNAVLQSENSTFPQSEDINCDVRGAGNTIFFASQSNNIDTQITDTEMEKIVALECGLAESVDGPEMGLKFCINLDKGISDIGCNNVIFDSTKTVNCNTLWQKINSMDNKLLAEKIVTFSAFTNSEKRTPDDLKNNIINDTQFVQKNNIVVTGEELICYVIALQRLVCRGLLPDHLTKNKLNLMHFAVISGSTAMVLSAAIVLHYYNFNIGQTSKHNVSGLDLIELIGALR